MWLSFSYACIFTAFRVRVLIPSNISHLPLYLLFPCSCSASRLLIAHTPASAQGTCTRWRWSILYWYTRLRWSILYWCTGWRWSILYSGDVGVEDRSMETVRVHMWLSFPCACIFNAFRVQFLIQSNISHRPSLLTLPMQL